MFNVQLVISRWSADMYDRNVTETNDVDFLLSVLGNTPRNVLEIACGSGRILVPMARAGHRVTGLDFDGYMLDRISPKAKGLGNIAWRKCDVIAYDWGRGYDAVVLAGNILFNIISDIEYETAQRVLILKAADALVFGGGIYIDYGYTMHPERWFGNSGDFVVWEGRDDAGNSGRMVLSGESYDRESGMDRFTRKFELTLADGRVIEQEIPCVKHFATLEQIHQWLDEAGMAVREEYGNYNREPIGETTDRAIIWALKCRR